MLTNHLHKDWDHANTTEDEEKETRMDEISNKDLIGMTEGRWYSSTNLENQEHLYPQFHSPNSVISVRDWDHDHPETTRNEEGKMKMKKENTGTGINDLNHGKICAIEHNDSPRPTRVAHMIEDNPGLNKVTMNPQTKKTLKKMKHTSSTKNKRGNWVHPKKNRGKYWNRLAKATEKNKRYQHNVTRKQSLTIDNDGILHNKPSFASANKTAEPLATTSDQVQNDESPKTNNPRSSSHAPFASRMEIEATSAPSSPSPVSEFTEGKLIILTEEQDKKSDVGSVDNLEFSLPKSTVSTRRMPGHAPPQEQVIVEKATTIDPDNSNKAPEPEPVIKKTVIHKEETEDPVEVPVPQPVKSTDDDPMSSSSAKNTTSAGDHHQPASSITGKPQDTSRLPMQRNTSNKEILSKKNIMKNSRHKSQEKFRLDPRDDLPRFSDSEKTSDLNLCQKIKLHGKTSQDERSRGEQRSFNAYKKDHYEYNGSKTRNFSDEQRHYNGYKKDPTMTLVNKKHKSMRMEQRQVESQRSTEPEATWKAPTSMDTGSASVPQLYDAQKESEQVL